jgi:hypothetical protein
MRAESPGVTTALNSSMAAFPAAYPEVATPPGVRTPYIRQAFRIPPCGFEPRARADEQEEEPDLAEGESGRGGRQGRWRGRRGSGGPCSRAGPPPRQAVGANPGAFSSLSARRLPRSSNPPCVFYMVGFSLPSAAPSVVGSIPRAGCGEVNAAGGSEASFPAEVERRIAVPSNPSDEPNGPPARERSRLRLGEPIGQRRRSGFRIGRMVNEATRPIPRRAGCATVLSI